MQKKATNLHCKNKGVMVKLYKFRSLQKHREIRERKRRRHEKEKCI